ncbi:alpha-hydroxy acid oxidase [Agrobacterium sp. lyk4-40-TYG-31]|uniref:alpha-hydroxy acid oxidase n=1 Tax=Agrobacterium sp. lyk4-40-TYG-31 TaxID=3040276 RepID=UPI00254F7F4F|nr:alpha-hydroxy acid oxidase [Agrobacterium sp. lyk4-40-TYG-31]
MTTFFPRRALASILNLDDFERAARRHLPKPVFAYVAGGSEDNYSLHDNRVAFRDIALMPRILRDVSRRTPMASLFGQEFSAPFGIAPMGLSALSAYRGDIVLARAAKALGIPAIMSGSSLIRLEDVAREAPETWFQAYVPPTRERTEALIRRIEAAGFTTLVITVDVSVLPNRENNIRAGFKTPLEPDLALLWQGISHPGWTINTAMRTLLNHGVPHFENNEAVRGVPIVSRNVSRETGGRDWLSWDHLNHLRERWKGKLVVKGVLHPDDVSMAAKAGVDAIILSNHGGRQLDGSPSAMRVLPAAVKAAGNVPVMIDGGFRRGTDIIKALALGAAFVWLGRPFNYAASVAGEAGVAHAYKLLRNELLTDMALVGVTTLPELSEDNVLSKSTAR